MSTALRQISAALIFALLMVMAVLGPQPATAQQPEFYEVPFAPGQWNIGRQLDQSHLRYCVDRRDPDWEVAAAIADTIAAGLLLEASRYLIESGTVREDITRVYQTLLEHCDIQMGFKLIPEGLPEWVIVTRPYYLAGYVFVTADPDLASIGDLAPARPIAATLGTAAHLQLVSYISALPPENRWRIFPLGTNELSIQTLLNGTADVALVWGPTFWAMQKADPALAPLRIIPPAPLRFDDVGVGGIMLSEYTFLRTAVDEAIAALTADGTIAEILAEHDFIGTVAE